jgi:hypothetical protein
MRLAAIGLALPALLALSCGGGSSGTPGSGTLTGTIHGSSFSPRDAISGNVPSPAGQQGVVVLTSAPGLCSLLTSGKAPRNSWFLILTAVQQQPDHTTAAPSAPGTYRLLDPNASAFAVFLDIGDQCQDLGPGADAFGASGAVTFTSVGNHYAGSFDLTFDSSDHATGTFDAPGCPALAKLVADRSDLTCQ